MDALEVKQELDITEDKIVQIFLHSGDMEVSGMPMRRRGSKPGLQGSLWRLVLKGQVPPYTGSL